MAVLAKEHGIPFYVAAPISTVDLETPDGSKIPIEQRNAREVTHIAGKQMVPDGVQIENPAFDVTPAKYVTAIVTERGIAKDTIHGISSQIVGSGSRQYLAATWFNPRHRLKAEERPSAWIVSCPRTQSKNYPQS